MSIHNKSFLPLFIFVLLFSACSHNAKPKTAKSVSPKEGQNSLYYYLVSEIETLKGEDTSADLYLNKSIAKDPNSAYLLIQQAYKYARIGKIEESFSLAQKARLKDPANTELALLLGKLYTSKANPAEAQKYFEEVLVKDSANEEAASLLARSFLEQKNTDEAIRVLNRFIDANPEAIAAPFYLANIYTTYKKDPAKAIGVYEKMKDAIPDDPKILTLVNEAYLAQKNYKKALETLLELKEILPHDLTLDVKIGLIYYELKDLDKAMATFEELLQKQPEAYKVAFYLGLMNQEKGNKDKALDYFANIPSDSDLYIEALTRRVIILKEQNKPEAVFTLLNKAIHDKPKEITLYDLLASVYATDQKFDEASKVLESALKKNPNNEHLYFSLGVLYDKMGAYDKSLSSMQQVIAINPQNALALNFVGYSYAEKGINLEQAKELILKALTIKPDDGFIMDSLGWVYFKQGDSLKANEWINKALRYSPKEPTILEHLGMLALEQADKKKARTYLEQSLFLLQKDSNSKKLDLRTQEQIERIKKKLGEL
ncbi:tetratricopeptide repeat protein [bacterium]|nr:tetratricopeptide repeat protein [bacterium]